MPEPITARSLDEIDWQTWAGDDLATLCFVIRGGQILLIRKKRGLGAGKINGPGGKLEPGETADACAIREVEEELGVTPIGLELRAEHRFQFLDGYKIHVFVFIAEDCAGEPVESDEAVPIWSSLDAIPYDEMWADDRLWLPVVLAGGRCTGHFLFDEDQMLDHHLNEGLY